MKKTIVLSIALLVVLLSSLGLAPAPQVDAAGEPQPFSSSMSLTQTSVTDLPRSPIIPFVWYSANETFEGTIKSSSGLNITNAEVVLRISANFLVYPTSDPLFFTFQGTSQANMDIKKNDGALAVKANGRIEGTLNFVGGFENPPLVTVVINDMSYNSTGGTGSLANNHIWGTMDVHFVTPYAIATLTGQYQ